MKSRVLVVDDDQNIAELISLYLEKEGYETKKVYDGKEAVKEFLAYHQLSAPSNFTRYYVTRDGWL